jgi:hypothetical protein
VHQCPPSRAGAKPLFTKGVNGVLESSRPLTADEKHKVVFLESLFYRVDPLDPESKLDVNRCADVLTFLAVDMTPKDRVKAINEAYVRLHTH